MQQLAVEQHPDATDDLEEVQCLFFLFFLFSFSFYLIYFNLIFLILLNC